MSSSVPADAPAMMAQGPDMVLVDLDGDGAQALAFLHRVREERGEIPVLIASCGDDPALVARARALGIEGIMPKRISGHELEHRVSRVALAPERMPVADTPRRRLDVLEPGHSESPVPPLSAPPSLASVPPVGIPRIAPAAAAAPSQMSGGRIAVAENKGGAARGEPGRFEAGDLVSGSPPGVAVKEAVGGLEPAGPSPARKRRDAVWEAELAQAGHRVRTGADVAGVDVSSVVALHAQWLGTQGAAGRRADFAGRDLAGADLAGAALPSAGFRGTDLSDARLMEARLDGADLRGAVLEAADCRAAMLGAAQLRHANLRLSNLGAANLRGADLSGAALAGCRVEEADFRDAILVETDLSDCDLSQARNLRQSQLDRARANGVTRVPPGLVVRLVGQ